MGTCTCAGLAPRRVGGTITSFSQRTMDCTGIRQGGTDWYRWPQDDFAPFWAENTGLFRAWRAATAHRFCYGDGIFLDLAVR